MHFLSFGPFLSNVRFGRCGMLWTFPHIKLNQSTQFFCDRTDLLDS